MILVLEIYRITLLSNERMRLLIDNIVLEIYRITLLSNDDTGIGKQRLVLEIYRITLLSNWPKPSIEFKDGFRDLQNYTTLKPQIKFEAQE